MSPSYLSRIELERRLPAPEVLQAMAPALDLDAAEQDRLYWAAGTLPPRLRRLPPGDRTVLAVVAVVTDLGAEPRRRAAFRRLVELLAAGWSADAPQS